jgi:hypothetical protein
VGFPGWLREVLWRADDWRQALARISVDHDGERGIELGRALEHVEPDRTRALAAYVAVWRDTRASAAAVAARRIAWEVRDHAVVAELAIAEHARGGEPGWLVVAAEAWLDAGQPARAGPLLADAAAEGAGDPRAVALAAAAAGQLADPRAEVARWCAIAGERDEPDAAAIAARIAKAAGLPDDVRLRLLRDALDRWPVDDDIAAQVEDVLLARGDGDDLLTFYRRRLATRDEPRAWADEVRAAASRLCVRGVAPALGLRLLRRGLEHAYDAGLVDVPGHLASWALLVDHGRAVRAARTLIPLAERAVALPVPDDDRLWLARFGVEVMWRGAGDRDGAAAFAAVMIDLVPDHPDVRDLDHGVDVDLDQTDPEIAALTRSLVYLDERARGPDDSPPARAARAVVPVDVTVGLDDGTSIQAVVRDLSTTGLFIALARPLVIGAELRLELRVPGADPLAVSRHRARARVVRHGDGGYGVVLVDPDPELVAAIATITTA